MSTTNKAGQGNETQVVVTSRQTGETWRFRLLSAVGGDARAEAKEGLRRVRHQSYNADATAMRASGTFTVSVQQKEGSRRHYALRGGGADAALHSAIAYVEAHLSDTVARSNRNGCRSILAQQAVLQIEKQKDVRLKHYGVGIVAKWSTKGLNTGFILQEVEHEVHEFVAGDNDNKVTTTNFFTEAWTTNAKGQVSPKPGNDYFLVPWGMHKTKGEIRITSRAWWIPKGGQTYTSLGLKREPTSIAGEYYFKVGQVDERFRCNPTVVRAFTANWEADDDESALKPEIEYVVVRGAAEAAFSVGDTT